MPLGTAYRFFGIFLLQIVVAGIISHQYKDRVVTQKVVNLFRKGEKLNKCNNLINNNLPHTFEVPFGAGVVSNF